MRGKSHRDLGRYLAGQYLSEAPKRYVKAFLIGCVEPDKNPITYLKGSLRRQWLRGHNYGNAQRYMQRISNRLECKNKLKLVDYYTIGKLIHYTTDAFTYAHNREFTAKLCDHRAYEQALQAHFLQYLKSKPDVEQCTHCSVMDVIRGYHRDYIRRPADVRTDSRYALNACCCVLTMLLAN